MKKRPKTTETAAPISAVMPSLLLEAAQTAEAQLSAALALPDLAGELAARGLVILPAAPLRAALREIVAEAERRGGEAQIGYEVYRAAAERYLAEMERLRAALYESEMERIRLALLNKHMAETLERLCGVVPPLDASAAELAELAEATRVEYAAGQRDRGSAYYCDLSYRLALGVLYLVAEGSDDKRWS